ncbi:hypothetical protein SAMN04487895_10182 [Paenibacillus sophorae]|uniref:Uncharacterized protein n=1 Tax=Paenibacillus sophorae TaxID=1333845 RepID=A0A1H8FDX2_9BACL|nr:hypothetical protein SAMN04487895_10182 [Paenibacillus sophorae]
MVSSWNTIPENEGTKGKWKSMGPEENDVKLRILQAAKKLFARQGFNPTTVGRGGRQRIARLVLLLRQPQGVRYPKGDGL